MLRRVARVARRGLLLVGVVVLLWLPLSFPFVAYSGPAGFGGIGSGDGCVSAWLSQLPLRDSSHWRAGIVRRPDDFPISWREAFLPTFREAGMLESRAAFAPARVSIPL